MLLSLSIDTLPVCIQVQVIYTFCFMSVAKYTIRVSNTLRQKLQQANGDILNLLPHINLYLSTRQPPDIGSPGHAGLQTEAAPGTTPHNGVVQSSLSQRGGNTECCHPPVTCPRSFAVKEKSLLQDKQAPKGEKMIMIVKSFGS